MDWDKFALIYDWEFDLICDYQKQDINFWERFAQKYGNNLLELGAGSGRVTLPLVKKGYNIYALDNSAKMLELLKIHSISIENGGELNMVQANMADFSLNRFFDAVIVSYSSLQHLTAYPDITNCLACIYRHLRPKGMVAFDLDPDVLSFPDTMPERQVYSGCNNQLKAQVTLFTSWFTDEKVRHWNDRYLLEYDDQHQEEFHNHIVLKALYLNEMLSMLTAAGFRITDIAGGFEGENFNEKSERMLITAQKKG
ncbi:MAG: class I SAM-dependent methyltransferase [Candidatus Cloacimonetes bacterium]|nr:class I SAM-dependent methyltransferase [Candidatus Cloacimonadota bacterium]